MKAVIYARFSTEQQSADSIEDQFRECDRHAERLKFTVIERFADEAISGGTHERPGYQAMLALGLLQHPDDLLLAESTFPHRSSSLGFYTPENSHFRWFSFGGARQNCTRNDEFRRLT